MTFEEWLYTKRPMFSGFTKDEIAQLAWQAAWSQQQARIDALMLEYCPDEMTPEQIEEWGRHQKPGEKE